MVKWRGQVQARMTCCEGICISFGRPALAHVSSDEPRQQGRSTLTGREQNVSPVLSPSGGPGNGCAGKTGGAEREKKRPIVLPAAEKCAACDLCSDVWAAAVLSASSVLFESVFLPQQLRDCLVDLELDAAPLLEHWDVHICGHQRQRSRARPRPLQKACDRTLWTR